MAERMSAQHVTHQMVVFGLSDQGLQRGNNEDHFMVADLTHKVIGVHENQLRPELFHRDIGRRGTVLMVADGLGGHAGGEIASQIAVDAVARALIEATEPVLPISAQISHAVHVAHAAICQYHGASGRTRHMASTLTAVHVGHGVMTIAQVGDSRAYRFRGGKLTLLTDDQTVVHMMRKKGMLTPEEAQNHPHRNIILQALGQDKSVSPEIQTLPFAHNDCLLLCSDGLSSYVAHEQIEAIMAAGEDERVLCRHLVEAANAAGGADNVTVLLARLIIKERVCVAAPGRSPAASGPRPATQASLTPTPNTAPTRPARLSGWKWKIRWPWWCRACRRKGEP
jgi:protein phosphatase